MTRPSAQQPPRQCGDLIANAYLLREVLGIGGMGVVYEAALADGAPGHTVAIKLLHLEHMTDPRAARRLHDEARAARCVSHPNVVAVLDVSAPGDRVPFVVMEHVRGVPLSSILRKVGTLPLLRAAGIARQILTGLEAIHAAGVVHGDINSANIVVEEHPDGRDTVKIIDFGCASIRRRGQPAPKPEYDAEGMLLTAGTPEYMAPELISSGQAIPASDLYALAVIVYQMITGRTPFRGGGAAVVLCRHLNDRVMSPSLRSPERFIPVAFEHAIMRGLEKQSRARFPTAATFAAALALATPATEPAPLEFSEPFVRAA